FPRNSALAASYIGRSAEADCPPGRSHQLSRHVRRWKFMAVTTTLLPGKIRNFNDFSIRKIRVELHNHGCGQGRHIWLRQEGTHVSYWQSSIISGGHIVRSSRGTGAAGCARSKAQSGSKRLSCTNGPTASSSFTVWASICAHRKSATPESAGKPCSDCCPTGNSANCNPACRAAASGAAAGNSTGDSHTGCCTAVHSAIRYATNGNEFVVTKRLSGRG